MKKYTGFWPASIIFETASDSFQLCFMLELEEWAAGSDHSIESIRNLEFIRNNE